MLCLPLWVHAVNALINHLMPNKNITTILIMAVLPIVILLYDDGSLDEFYKYDNNNNNKNLLLTSGYEYQSK
jgi:hypothetical protein